MDPGPLSHLHLPRELDQLADDDPRVETLLSRWDELPPARLAEFAAHRTLGPRLARLQAAERWLGRGLAAREAREGSRPDPEELYDYGGGPGARTPRRALATDRKRAIERHLEGSPEEAAWVAALARRPPPPLVLEPPLGSLQASARDAVGPSDAAHGAGTPPTLGRWIPLAAAVLVIAFGVALVQRNRMSLPLPYAATLRGALSEPLHFPRGVVLGAPNGAVGLFAVEPRYEFRAVHGATAHRVVLRRHDGSAFDVGEVVFEATTTESSLVGPPLVAGHYAWEVLATVDGLERSLGTQSFVVVDDPAALAHHSQRSLPEQVRSLAARGFLTDARHRARLMPPGPERDRFLGALPER